MILDEIVAAKRQELQDQRRRRPFRSALRAEGGCLQIIAELKRASPSRGVLRSDWDAVDLAQRYAAGGAAALSVLTERRFFQADPSDLGRVRQAVDLPLLRKDFIFDPWQVHESVHLGADAMLLIVAVTGAGTGRLVDLALELGLEPLVEVHDEAEMELALATRAQVIGINNRDLRSFRTDLGVTRRLAPLACGEGRTVITESGITTARDLDGLAELGVSAALVGESLLRAADPAAAVQGLRG